MEQALTLMGRRKLAVLEDIVEATMELFRRDGFEETTVDAIVAAAGCSRSTFYRYFRSKEDVLFYDFPEVFARLAERIDNQLAAGADAWAAVSAALIESEFSEAKPFQRLEFWRREPALHVLWMEQTSVAEDVIVGCLTRHRGTKAERDEMAQLIAMSAISAYRTCLVTHASRKPERFTENLRALLARLGNAFT